VQPSDVPLTNMEIEEQLNGDAPTAQVSHPFPYLHHCLKLALTIYIYIYAGSLNCWLGFRLEHFRYSRLIYYRSIIAVSVYLFWQEK
jgi:hypothetical protein